MLKKLEPDQMNADELVTKDFTDKDIVDNFERINYYSQLIGQFQNIREYFEKNNIQPTDEEDGMFGVTADIEAAEKHFDAPGVKKEDLEYRIVKDGKVLGTKPFNRDSAGFDLGDNFHSRIEIVNKNDPSNKVAIFSDSRGEFARSVLKNSMVPPKAHDTAAKSEEKAAGNEVKEMEDPLIG